MVAVVNSVVAAAVASLAMAAAGVDPLGLPLGFAAVVGAGALTLHQRHHRRARDTYTPKGVDRAAIFVPPSSQAETA
jgi:Na+/H+ antiporter NhaD/arsenite permease-like protein